MNTEHHANSQGYPAQPARYRQLNTCILGANGHATGPIVYWMDRDMRLRDNWALLHAQKLASTRGVGLVIVYNLVLGFLGGGMRQWQFKLQALQELQKDAEVLSIPCIVCIDETGKDTPKLLHDICTVLEAQALVTDFSPLRIQRQWKAKLALHLEIPCIEVDAHNIVPAWIASQKSEYGAYTLRPKLHKLLPTYLEEIPKLSIDSKMKAWIMHDPRIKKVVKTYEVDWKALASHPKLDTTVEPVDWIQPGEHAAHKALALFLSHALTRYGDKRNDPLADAQSNLSPYLHYGMISAHRVALETLAHTGYTISEVLDEKKNKAKVDLDGPLHMIDHVGAFLEELIVRRELADNFCLFNPDYDSVKCFPAWAQETLRKHKDDPREYTYTKSQFEHAHTHDDLWNAAQLEMVRTGKMHGYMRMYWAKKILEWSKDYEEAQWIAIYLNDKYELDGRDPNGYAGIAWSIGGVHDRAWFPRPIFGTVRYMARSGCEKKFDVDAYIAKWIS